MLIDSFFVPRVYLLAQGKRRNYLFKMGELGLGYYRNDTVLTSLGKVGTQVGTSADNEGGDNQGQDAAEAKGQEDEEAGVVLELPMPEPNEEGVEMDELRPLTEDELNSSSASSIRLLSLARDGRQFCRYHSSSPFLVLSI